MKAYINPEKLGKNYPRLKPIGEIIEGLQRMTDLLGANCIQYRISECKNIRGLNEMEETLKVISSLTEELRDRIKDEKQSIAASQQPVTPGSPNHFGYADDE